MLMPGSVRGGDDGSRRVALSDVGLDDSSEDVDAVAARPGGSIALSVTGRLDVPGLQGGAADVATFLPGRLGPDTAGTFAADLAFDGSPHGLGGNDVTAFETG
jgi:hypothetical protein